MPYICSKFILRYCTVPVQTTLTWFTSFHRNARRRIPINLCSINQKLKTFITILLILPLSGHKRVTYMSFTANTQNYSHLPIAGGLHHHHECQFLRCVIVHEGERSQKQVNQSYFYPFCVFISSDYGFAGGRRSDEALIFDTTNILFFQDNRLRLLKVVVDS